MKSFATRICPLCSKKVKLGDEESPHDFYCEEFYLRHAGPGEFFLMLDDNYSVQAGRRTRIKEPHYAVDIREGQHLQSTIIPPYWIITTEGDQKTRIYKFGKDITHPTIENLLLEVPIIVPSDYLPDQFARKIKNLVIFS